MDREEAKHLLELYRSDHQEDRNDPAIAEALAWLESDTELREWFEAQQSVDARITEHLQTIEIPEGFDKTILAGMRLHALNPGEDDGPRADEAEQAPPLNPFSLKPWIGLAALFLVAMALLNLPKPQTPEPLAYAGIPPILQFLSNELDTIVPASFELRDASVRNLQDYLSGRNAPSPRSLPSALKALPTVGCVTFEFGGAQLSMICFKNGGVYHLITTAKDQFPGELEQSIGIFEIDEKAFQLWIEGDQVHILTVHGCAADLPEII